jgi:hypothetical protein
VRQAKLVRPSRARHPRPYRETSAFAAVHQSVVDAVDGSSVRHVSAMDVRAHDSEELPMQTITTIGLDIAKSIFQVHGVDAGGQVVIRRQLKRRYVLVFFQKLPPCLVDNTERMSMRVASSRMGPT